MAYLLKRSLDHFLSKPIRYKLFVTYSFIAITIAILVGTIVYFQIVKTIKKNIENELSNATATIQNMIKTTAQASIKNYLRAVAEKNLEIVSYYYSDVQSGVISEAEAKNTLRKILFNQTIGETGYIYCVNSKGIAVEHPNPSVKGVDFSHFAFIQEQMRRKEGYLQYEWKNPGEQHFRPKAVYMTYFEPWDWIISVSSYRSEFTKLINISDFKESILSLRFGKTGYSYVIDGKGNVVVHPWLSGNILASEDANGIKLVQYQCETKNGQLIYSWRNPGEKKFRPKLVIFNYIKEYDWIVASSSYLQEFYAPLLSIRYIIMTTVAFIVVLVLPITFKIADSITRPLRQLEKNFSQSADGDFTRRMPVKAKDEIGKLAAYYNHFMDRLETYNQKIHKEINERRKTEELFSKAFRSSPSGIFIINLNDKVLIDANQSFLNFIGRDHSEIVGHTIDNLSILEYPAHLNQLIELLTQNEVSRNMNIEFTNAEGELRVGIVNAETINIWGKPCILCAVENLTETIRLEREIVDISERERLQLGHYLHDDLCSHLLGIEVNQTVLRQKLAKQGFKDLGAVDKVRDLILQAIDKTGRISRGLCPTHIAEQQLELTLKELCSDIEQIFKVTCRLECGEDHIILKPSVARHIYYIAREAAYNAVKHGNANNIKLNIFHKNSSIILQIRDNGCGLPEIIPNKGMGLKIMHYRSRRIGAVLNIQKAKEGTTITLIFSSNGGN